MKPEQLKAWSQNLGYEKVLTTFLSCGAVACQRQREIIRGLTTPQQVVQPDAVTDSTKMKLTLCTSNGRQGWQRSYWNYSRINERTNR